VQGQIVRRGTEHVRVHPSGEVAEGRQQRGQRTVCYTFKVRAPRSARRASDDPAATLERFGSPATLRWCVLCPVFMLISPLPFLDLREELQARALGVMVAYVIHLQGGVLDGELAVEHLLQLTAPLVAVFALPH
jgi:hypothetical protein